MSPKAARVATSPKASKGKGKPNVAATKDDADSPKKRRKLSTGSTQSCHQCRQSILSNKGISELKAGKARRQCDSCTTYWCENCLENRYGLSFVEISGQKWSCPKCLKTCNCSICRKRAGMLATGILTPLAKEAGFTSVNDFLSKGTGAIAECLQWKEVESSPAKSPKKTPKASSSPKKASKSEQKGTKRKRGSGGDAAACVDAESAAPAAKRSRKQSAPSDSRRRVSFEIEPVPKKAPRRRTSLEEKRVSADEYRLRLAQRQQELARDKQEEKLRKKDDKADESKKARELKQRAMEELRQRKALEKERKTEEKERKTEEKERLIAQKQEERRQSQEFKQAALEEMRRQRAEEIERQKEAKRQEMEQLRLERAACKQQKQEEHKQQIEAMRLQKAAERERDLEQKKLELARLREEKARARDDEREMKRLQLETLRAHVQAQKQVVKDLLSVGPTYSRSNSTGSKPNFSRTPSNASTASSDSESGVDCEFLVPPVVDDDSIQDICIDVELPELPAWEVPIPLSQYNNLLLISEFLTSFSGALGLSGSYTAERLGQTLLNRSTLPSLHLAVLRALLKAEALEQEDDEDDGFDEDDDVEGRVQLDDLPKLTSSSCQQVLELYLAMVGYQPDSTVKGAGRRKLSADERTICDKLPVLAFLCERLNGMKFIADVVNETSENLVELQRKHRISEREVCKQINEELKAWTAEQLMARKDCKSIGDSSDLPSASERFSKQIAEIRSKQQCEQDERSAAVRGHLLGRDRSGRAYWHLRSVSGVLVEEDITDVAEGDGKKRGAQKKLVNPFTICRTSDLLDKLLDALCVDHPAEAALSHQLKLRCNSLCPMDSA